MTVLVDDGKAVEITIREWDDESVQYGPNWSNDFFEVGALEEVDGLDDTYWVDDVDYCVKQVMIWWPVRVILRWMVFSRVSLLM